MQRFTARKTDGIYQAIGLMSGTSMDGIDAAIIKSDGDKILEFGATHFKEYPGWLKLKIRKLIAEIQADSGEKPSEFYIKEVERDITKLHADAVEELLINAKLHPAEIDVIGFHGHTVDHRPHEKFTWQIGDGQLLASRTGIDVVCNFRVNDVKLGGQGAPLLPLYHKAVIPEKSYPAAVVNIGGVSNITYIDNNNLIAFDCGPGNALIDDIIFENTGQHFDEEGKVASDGKVSEDLLNLLLNNLYFTRKPPKSLDRNQFTHMVSNQLQGEYKYLLFADKVATLSEFTVQAIARSQEHLPDEPRNWYICGGGVHNKYFMRRFDEIFSGKVQPISRVNVDLDANFIEAQGFAFLGIRSMLDLPITFTSTTGVISKTASATGGELFKVNG